MDPRYPLLFEEMGTQFLVETPMRPFPKKIKVLFRKK
jgi:hypothetical protein